MGTTSEERKQVAKAILDLHKLYISTGEENKPMTISLDDLAGMADLPKEITESVLMELLDEKSSAQKRARFLF